MAEEAAVKDDRKKLSSDINPIAWLIWVVGLVLSLLGTWMLVREQTLVFPTVAVLLYLAGAVLTAGGTGLALSLTDPAGWAWASLSGVMALLVGPLGVVMGVVCYLMARGQPTGQPLTEVVKAEMWIKAEEPEEVDELAPLDLKIREQARTEPIVDLLPYADVATAIAIVNRLRERGNHDDIQMIRQISRDPRPEVYQYAISQLDRLEKEFAGRIYRIEADMKAQPARTELRIDLAREYLRYIDSGLLDEGLRDYYWELTLAHVFEAMLAHPRGEELAVDVAHLLHMQGLYKSATRVAQAALKRAPESLQGQLLVLQTMVDQAQAEGKYTLLREARTRALESAWAVPVPKKREAGAGPTFDLAHFWFEGRKSNA
ncbi:MAG: hypothetical protein AB7S38_03465 [Vulcanimicrobiota bacterium]